MPADEAHAALIALHGIGPWTADIYLLFCLGHADAWPAGDLALQEAARIAFGLPSASDREGDGPARRRLAAVARRWRRSCCGPTIAPSSSAKARRIQTEGQSRAAKKKRKKECEARMAAELDGPRLEPPSGAARQLVVFLHGYGADGNDLIDIGRAWQALLPDAAFVSPHAPEPAGRRRWAGNGFRSRSAIPTSAGSASTRPRRCSKRFLDAELARHNLPPTALALVGFSQGTMMALHVGLRRAVRACRDRRLFRHAGAAG